MEKGRKFLVPVDFSEASASGLKYAVSLAQETQAELLVLHVAENPDTQAYWHMLAIMEGYPPHKEAASNTGDHLLRARTLDLANFVQQVVRPRRPVKIRKRVELGNKRKEIARVAKEEKVDLVVFSVPKPSLFSYLMEQGKLLKMIWHLPCPMLLRTAGTKAALNALSPLSLANMRR
jgi:nucleotide-binding universal stress UspA family protein